MLNKKSVLNFVYAFALVGMVLSCVAILSEFFNIAQLYHKNIYDDFTSSKYYFRIYFFYLVAFIISAYVVAFLILNMFDLLKKLSKKNYYIIISASCTALLIMSFVFVYLLSNKGVFTILDKEYESFGLTDFEYLSYYTFRTCIMSFVANAGIVVACNVLNEKCKKNDAESGEDA